MDRRQWREYFILYNILSLILLKQPTNSERAATTNATTISSGRGGEYYFIQINERPQRWWTLKREIIYKIKVFEFPLCPILIIGIISDDNSVKMYYNKCRTRDSLLATQSASDKHVLSAYIKGIYCFYNYIYFFRLCANFLWLETTTLVRMISLRAITFRCVFIV